MKDKHSFLEHAHDCLWILRHRQCAQPLLLFLVVMVRPLRVRSGEQLYQLPQCTLGRCTSRFLAFQCRS